MEQTQRQVALPSTILVGQMLEKSFEEAVQYVNDELDKNPALEMSSPEPEPNKGNESESFDGNDSTKGNDNNDYDPRNDYRNDDDAPAISPAKATSAAATTKCMCPKWWKRKASTTTSPNSSTSLSSPLSSGLLATM